MTTVLRDTRIDSVRGLAMAGIVAIHIHSYYNFFHSLEDIPVLFSLVLANLSRFSVPVFIFSAGYFSKDSSFGKYWKSKILVVAIPYSIVSLLGYYIKFNDYSISDFLYRLLYGKVFTPFYFIPLLFQFYILYYCILRKLKTNGKLGFLVISLVINIASNLNLFKFFTEDYSIIWVGNFIFFFAAGLYLADKSIDFWKGNPILAALIPISFLIVSCYLIYETVHSKLPISNHTVLYPTLGFLVFYSVSFGERLNKILSAIGRNSLGIFLFHPFVIHFMHSIDPYELGGPWLGILLTLVLNLFIPYIAWVSLQRIIRYL
jgi:surface polysaccharide O-acyltransferase-like enzyme